MASIVRATFKLTFHYRPFVSVDSRGTATYGEAQAALCRVQPSRRLIRDARGQAVAEEAVLFTEAQVSENDLVWPPGVELPEDGSDTRGSRRPLVVHVRYLLFATAPDHYEVHL